MLLLICRVDSGSGLGFRGCRNVRENGPLSEPEARWTVGLWLRLRLLDAAVVVVVVLVVVVMIRYQRTTCCPQISQQSRPHKSQHPSPNNSQHRPHRSTCRFSSMTCPLNCQWNCQYRLRPKYWTTYCDHRGHQLNSQLFLNMFSMYVSMANIA